MLLARILRLRSAVMACALVAAPCAVDAQTPVRSGSVVRILAPSVADSLLTGTVLEIDSASLVLAPPARKDLARKARSRVRCSKPASRIAHKILRSRPGICARSRYAAALPQDDMPRCRPGEV